MADNLLKEECLKLLAKTMKVKIKLSTGSIFEKVTPKTSFIIGRSQKCDIPVPDDSLSRNHCQVDFENETFFITDLDSSNGVFIDGKRIPSQKKVSFTTFQEVFIGLLEVSFIDNDEPRITTSTPKKDVTNPKGFKDRTTPPRKVQVSQKKNNTLLKTILISAIIVAGAAYYQFFNPQELEDPSLSPPTETSQSSTPMNLEFYQAADSSKSCDAEFRELCTSFQLVPDDQEGISLDDNQYFVFIRTKSHTPSSSFAQFKDANAAIELEILQNVLNSNLFEKFVSGTKSKLHIVFKNQNYQIIKVLSLKPEKFVNAESEKTFLLSALFSSTTSGNPDDFWSKSSSYFEIQNF